MNLFIRFVGLFAALWLPHLVSATTSSTCEAIDPETVDEYLSFCTITDSLEIGVRFYGLACFSLWAPGWLKMAEAGYTRKLSPRETSSFFADYSTL